MPFAVDDRLGPRVRVGLTNDHVAAARINFTALIAGDHARRNAGCAQQHDERACIVLAKSAPGIEQEHVDRIAIEQRRRERVDERLGAKPGQDRADVIGIVGMLLTQFLREHERPRVPVFAARGRRRFSALSRSVSAG